jgi:ketosteroid isomerase-like protein
MGAPSNMEVLERWIEILNTNAFDKLEEVLHPDYAQEIPQSGERVRGIENMRQVLRNYPGGFQLARFQRLGVVGSSARYLMTAAFSVVKVEGSDDILGVYMKAHYPDGSDWYYASFLEFRDHKILKGTDFFGPLFDPPAWRTEWVERMDSQ